METTTNNTTTKKHWPLVILGIIVVGLLIAATIFLSNKHDLEDTDTITGIVSEVTYRPNRAEDGYYALIVTDNKNNSYQISATGYMNTPLSPSENHEACVIVPRIEKNQSVTFKLPKTTDGSYQICYDESLASKHYFFQVNNNSMSSSLSSAATSSNKSFGDIANNIENGAQLIDVRTPEEYATEHVEGAINIPLSDIQAGMRPTVDSSKAIYVYCRSGARATQATNILQSLGYTVVNLGGMSAVIQMGGKSSASQANN